MKFSLADIPDDWWVRLNDQFVDELDRLNRPYKYGLATKRIARYWEAGELHRRVTDKMSPEEKAGYKRRHSFFEKLWGRHRYKDYHFDKDDPRRYVNTGSWIEKKELSVLKEGIEIDDVNLNKAITGFRVAKFSDNVREMQFKQLPIIADENWAWLFGIYFGAGTMYHYVGRKGPHSRKGGFDSIYIRIRVPDPVIPKFLEVSAILGLHAVKYQMQEYSGDGQRKIKGTGKVGVGRREYIVFGWPEYVVLKKFGLPTEYLDEVQNKKDYQLTSSGYKPKIPDWILENEGHMKRFIEGYMCTGKCVSSLKRTPQQSSNRKMPSIEVKIQGIGYPESYIKTFMQQIHLWFARNGVLPGGFREAEPTGKDRSMFTIGFHELDALRWLKGNMRLDQPALRARIYARLEAAEDPVVYEALRRYGNPENVILGCLLEQPMSAKDIEYDLRMYDHAAEDGLDNLVTYGLAKLEGDLYFYEPSRFIETTIMEYKELAEEKRQRMESYSEQLLYQCGTCREVYIRKTEICDLCGEDVHPRFRRSVLRRLNTQAKYDLIIAAKLEAAQ